MHQCAIGDEGVPGNKQQQLRILLSSKKNCYFTDASYVFNVETGLVNYTSMAIQSLVLHTSLLNVPSQKKASFTFSRNSAEDRLFQIVSVDMLEAKIQGLTITETLQKLFSEVHNHLKVEQVDKQTLKLSNISNESEKFIVRFNEAARTLCRISKHALGVDMNGCLLLNFANTIHPDVAITSPQVKPFISSKVLGSEGMLLYINEESNAMSHYSDQTQMQVGAFENIFSRIRLRESGGGTFSAIEIKFLDLHRSEFISPLDRAGNPKHIHIECILQE